jgi:hypothetical protein
MVATDETLAAGMLQAAREGIASAQAMVFNIFCLMWLRTVMNHQYRHGGSTLATFATLWREGGVPRFYSGLTAALIQGPMSRGVAAAANFATIALLAQSPITAELPTFVKTTLSSIGVALFRLICYPLDTIKTMSQVEGAGALSSLREKVKTHGYGALWHGASFSVLSIVIRHIIWYVVAPTDCSLIALTRTCIRFSCYNYLQASLIGVSVHESLTNAAVGAVSAVVTNILSNPLTVIKTYRQTNVKTTSYSQIIDELMAESGWLGLFASGLTTRIWVDVLNSAVFTVVWRWLAPTASS